MKKKSNKIMGFVMQLSEKDKKNRRIFIFILGADES